MPGGARSRPTPTSRSTGLSARNRLHGFIEEVRVDGLLAQVRLRVGDQSLTAVITADAVRALKLRRGDDALAIIKSTEVMIARSGAWTERSGQRQRADGSSGSLPSAQETPSAAAAGPKPGIPRDSLVLTLVGAAFTPPGRDRFDPPSG